MAGLAVPPGQRELIADIIAQFRSALGELRCIGSQRLRHHGVSPGHLHVVSMLERHGGMPMSRVADVLDVSLSAATGIVDRMEERGLIQRTRPADDRRVVFVEATDAGRRMLEDVEVIKGEMLGSVLGRLGPAELEALAASVADVRRAFDEAVKSEPDLFDHHHHAPDREPASRPNHTTTEGHA
jgi:DNA-binding MarR family transcriptional regulator